MAEGIECCFFIQYRAWPPFSGSCTFGRHNRQAQRWRGLRELSLSLSTSLVPLYWDNSGCLAGPIQVSGR